MYSWKIANKFRFGRSKEEKEKEKDKEREREKSKDKEKHGLFHHKSHRSESPYMEPPRDSVDRKETIVASTSSIAPVRLSSDVNKFPTTNSSISTGRDSQRTSSDFNNMTDSTGYASNNGFGSSARNSGLYGGDPGNPNVNDETTSSHDVMPESEPLFSGIMTIKVYGGEGFKLPVPITSNVQILKKLLQSGVINPSSEDPSTDELVSSLSQLDLSGGNEEENLIDGDLATRFIPATITLPSSTDLNPLLYFTIEFDNTVATIEPESGTISHLSFNKISTFDVTRKLPFLKIDILARIPSILLPSKAWQQSNSSDPYIRDILDRINNNQDIHLDSYNLPLTLDFDSATSFRLYNHQWVSLENGNGKLNISVDYKPATNRALSIDDFDLLKVIGKGSFGKVMQVKKKDTNKVYALKAIRKSYIVSKSEVVHTLAERTVLARVDNPFIVPLKFTFQSPDKLYIVLAFINGGELFYHLQREGRFSLSRARFYAAELLCALETLHNLDVIYRDLKPENILLDHQGHIALCDFGLCKLNMKGQEKTNTFCGTPEYLAPELLLGQGYSKVVDWWTLGVLLYEMMTGLPPYYDEDVPKMYKKILQEPLRFPDGFDKDAKDLLIGLLSRDPKRRLGFNGADEIKSHAFFSQLSWKRLWTKGYIPPYKPPVMSSLDTSNFDQEFTKELPVDSVVNDYLSESVQQQFGGWTYVGSEQLGSSLAPGRSVR
ncbi:LANO_0D07162g1_1 [Lachancea nothofagi CBS 11611]|uniref:non-specific serine/threonine protein kinase n=1 Tax=Lachancea nothofagi CBS 11611 TaxID=1266666 RepID=A0A1G4JI14_9SACH|nr:LANO_0D07162g1_1 [Lachancea nothofagi CBS 11611]